MTTLTVWKFDTPDGAAAAADALQAKSQEELLTINDGAIVSWQPDAKRPKTKQLNNLTAIGALDGSFWGLLFGVLFFMPLLGMAVGAAAGAIGGALSDVGISDDFIERVRAKITPGTSALFLMTSGEKPSRLTDVFADATLIESNLTEDELKKLNDTFAEA